ncbi:putative inactive peptidyl-prolyl cis-trans isomerase-like 6 [Babylonia areolata]|uniref:putative inactive peptidyl-prolyl cis-trans isomerase-like 6 n=1 Tax=Babylonia areolata TaxID=304850 RepID=UPI003FD587C8
MASKQKIELFGLTGDVSFMRARCCAEDIYQANPEKLEKPVEVPMLQFEWDTFLNEKRRELRGEMWHYNENSVAFVDGEVKGGPADFIAWARREYNFEEFRPLPLSVVLTQDRHSEYISSRQHPFVYMDIVIGDKDVGRLVIELFSNLLPKTCTNFAALCTGEKGVCEETGIRLTYVGSLIHRLVPGGWIQGGDIERGHGNGGTSIYGRVFEDETFAIRHDKRGIVGMANCGRHTNQSQFYIILQPTPWMDGKYVAFGQLVNGGETLQKIEEVNTINERPSVDVCIKACGTLKFCLLGDLPLRSVGPLIKGEPGVLLHKVTVALCKYSLRFSTEKVGMSGTGSRVKACLYYRADFPDCQPLEAFRSLEDHKTCPSNGHELPTDLHLLCLSKTRMGIQ